MKPTTVLLYRLVAAGLLATTLYTGVVYRKMETEVKQLRAEHAQMRAERDALKSALETIEVRPRPQ